MISCFKLAPVVRPGLLPLAWALPTCFLAGFLVTASTVHAGPVDSFGDIEFWVGSGSQQAALAIDWHGQDLESQSVVWGYRWEGSVTSADMFQEIVVADPRLFAKVGPIGNLGMAVFGIGFDASGDGSFGLDDGTIFGAGGLVTTGPTDLAMTVDSSDLYQEGWFLGYWHQGVTQGEPTEWESGPGLSDRDLADGDWESLAFTTSIFDQSSFASHLLAAEEEGMLGDYSKNGRIDAADFTVWRDQRGATLFAAGYGADGNRDFQVDDADWIVWRDAYVNAGATVPEPRIPLKVWTGIAGLCLIRTRRQFPSGIQKGPQSICQHP